MQVARLLAPILVGPVALASTSSEPPCALKIQATHFAALPGTGGWNLDLTGTRVSVATVGSGGRELKLGGDAVDLLCDLVKRERFFDLKAEFGRSPVDAPFRVLDVWAYGKHGRVGILADLTVEEDREGLRRALRVWLAVRSLFDIPGVIDTRKSDEAILAQEPQQPQRP